MHLWDGLWHGAAPQPGDAATPEFIGGGRTLRSASSAGAPAAPPAAAWARSGALARANSAGGALTRASSASRGGGPRAVPEPGGGSQPVLIPGALPYSRLRVPSASSVSPSPSQAVLAEGSPGPEELLAPGGAQLARARASGGGGGGPEGGVHKRPPLPPSPSARGPGPGPGSFHSHSPVLAAAWLAPGGALGGSGSGPRGGGGVLGGAGAPGSLGGTGSLSRRGHQQLLASALAGSPPVGGEGLLSGSFGSAAAIADAVAAAAGNPHHPHHEQTMAALLQHQQFQLAQLQQQQALQAHGASPLLGGRSASLRASAGPAGGGYVGLVGHSPQSPRVLGALRRSSSQNRVSELGTSPGLIEASFMGMAAPRRADALPAPRGGDAGGTTYGSLPGAARRGGGMRAPPGSSAGAHWVSMADDRESAARGLLGLPRPAQQPRGLVRAGSSGGLDELGLGEIIPAGTMAAAAAAAAATSASASASAPADGFVGFGAGAAPVQQAAPTGAVPPTPAKIGQGPFAGGSAPAPGAWLAEEAAGTGSGGGQPAQAASRAFRRAASALAGDRASSSAAAAAVAAAAAAEAAALERMGSGLSPRGSAAPPGGADASPRAGRGAGLLRPPGSAPASPAAAGSAAGAGAGGGSPFVPRSYSRRGAASAREQQPGGGLPRAASASGLPTCLICLDALTPEDFEAGEAMQLDCRCKGEVALRHRSCAEKWSRVKGSTLCDVCRAPIRNLPDVPPLPPPPPGAPADGWGLFDPPGAERLWAADEPAGAADYVFDFIRVTWVVLIVCILFLELTVGRAFVTGALVGSAYVALAASWSAAARRRRQLRVAHAAAMWAATGQAGGAPGGGDDTRVPLLHADGGGGGGLLPA
ncbi:hypothetical protein HT031_001377 [Scenedesmus sp. PABB004]|nr:hypothetical protein HT031_001377 [Scenedesmus sp. PABB004]